MQSKRDSKFLLTSKRHCHQVKFESNSFELQRKCSIFPLIFFSLGSGVVSYYLSESGVIEYLEKLGFHIVGYGCMTCIGNSGPLHENVANVIEKNGLVCCGVLSGNRNFEGRIHPSTRANYLASPLLVIAYALGKKFICRLAISL